MSMRAYGIIMYGVSCGDLRFKDFEGLLETAPVKKWLEEEEGIVEDDFVFDEFLEDGVFGGVCETNVALPNGKDVYISLATTEDAKYIGFYAGYPWQKGVKGIKRKDVEEAIWLLLESFLDMSKADFLKEVGEISDSYYA